MPSPHPAVTPASIAIAKKYGKSVSKGIAAMEKKITEQTKEISTMGSWIEERV
jgi:hypothetical protein